MNRQSSMGYFEGVDFVVKQDSLQIRLYKGESNNCKVRFPMIGEEIVLELDQHNEVVRWYYGNNKKGEDE